MSSIWFQEAQNHNESKEISQSIKTEVAVIGGGLSGSLTAYRLQEAGVKVILLTKGDIGEGQSGNNTGKITAQHGCIYHKINRIFGLELTKQYARANEIAVEQYKNLILEKEIPCDFEEKSAFLYSDMNYNDLLYEWKTLCDLDVYTSFLPHVDLPFSTKGAILWERQGQFNPVKFMQALAEELEIYTHSKVTDVRGNHITVNGYQVEAEQIVFACHVPFKGTYFPRMYQSRAYVIALKNAPLSDGMFIGMADDSLSLRTYQGYTLLCGQDHRTGHHRFGGSYQTLKEIAQDFWKDSEVVAQWSAQDGMTLDNIPYIGRFSPLQPNWYVATGFGKWGISTSMVAAQLIADDICGKDNENAEIFTTNRLPRAALYPLFQAGKDACIGLSKELFSKPEKTVEDLPLGHGGVVETVEGKFGIYKDEKGEIHRVTTRCPHLGCELAWNPDEKSWDCPCHGSRFDYTGKLLDGPALEDIT